MSRRRKNKWLPVNGILLLDKPTGISSNQALQQVRKVYQAQKAGHTGSLDPLATGMLPICFGEATKISAYLLDAAKQYRVIACTGIATDTGDEEGKVIETSSVPKPNQAKFDRVIQQFLGEIEQIPPMYSALKHEGKRLYELARAGKSVERAARKVIIDAIDVLNLDDAGFSLQVRCSKGTYIRTLVEDIAAAYGTCAHVHRLHRTSVDPFQDQPMFSIEQLSAMQQDSSEELQSCLLNIDYPLSHWPIKQLFEDELEWIKNGRAIPTKEEFSSQHIRLYNAQDRFMGIAEYKDNIIQPRKIMQL